MSFYVKIALYYLAFLCFFTNVLSTESAQKHYGISQRMTAPLPNAFHQRRPSNSINIRSGGGEYELRENNITIADPVVLASVFSMAGGITASSMAILIFSALPDSIGPAFKSLTSALSVWISMVGLEKLGEQKRNISNRYAILSSVSQGISISAAGAIVFSMLWWLENSVSTLALECGAVLGASLDSLRYSQRRPPHAVQLVVPYAIALLAVHFEPFLTFRGYVRDEKSLAFARTMSINAMSNRWSFMTGSIAIVLIYCMYLTKSLQLPEGKDNNLRGLVAYLHETNALPVVTVISIFANQLWTLVTVGVWLFKEMPYYGFGVVSVMLAILHFSCWSLLDGGPTDIDNIVARENNYKELEKYNGKKETKISSIIARGMKNYKILQECIFALGIGRLIYWEFTDSYGTSLGKHFYSLIACFTAFGISSSYSRSTTQTIIIISTIFLVLMRMVVAYLFSSGVNGAIIASSLGLGIGVLTIGVILAVG